MKKCLLTASVVLALTVPALSAEEAKEGYYIVFDSSEQKCSMVTEPPTETEQFKIMGSYHTEEEAKMAMAGMGDC